MRLLHSEFPYIYEGKFYFIFHQCIVQILILSLLLESSILLSFCYICITWFHPRIWSCWVNSFQSIPSIFLADATFSFIPPFTSFHLSYLFFRSMLLSLPLNRNNLFCVPSFVLFLIHPFFITGFSQISSFQFVRYSLDSILGLAYMIDKRGTKRQCQQQAISRQKYD